MKVHTIGGMSIDLPLLLRQRRALLRAIERTANPQDKASLSGVMSLLDRIHHASEEEGRIMTASNDEESGT